MCVCPRCGPAPGVPCGPCRDKSHFILKGKKERGSCECAFVSLFLRTSYLKILITKHLNDWCCVDGSVSGPARQYRNAEQLKSRCRSVITGTAMMSEQTGAQFFSQSCPFCHLCNLPVLLFYVQHFERLQSVFPPLARARMRDKVKSVGRCAFQGRGRRTDAAEHLFW